MKLLLQVIYMLRICSRLATVMSTVLRTKNKSKILKKKKAKNSGKKRESWMANYFNGA